MLSFNFHWLSTKQSIIQTLLNAGLFPTFDVIEIHMTSQKSFSVDLRNESNIFSVDQGIKQKTMENCINFLTNQNKRYAIILINNK